MKIVGIVLLALLGLVILLLVLVLFVPFTYRLRGSCHAKELRLDGRIFCLAGLLGGGVEIREKEMGLYLRILGIKKRLGGRQKQKKERTEKSGGDHPDRAEQSDFAGIQEPEGESIKVSLEKTAIPGQQSTSDIGEKPVGIGEKLAGALQKLTGIPQRCRDAWEKLIGIPQKCRSAWEKLTDTVSDFRQKAHCIAKEIEDEQNRQAVRFLVGQLLYLLRHLAPRRTKLKLSYSTGSPDTTGQLLGVLALFPYTYRGCWNITPDFAAEEFYVEADFDVRGHIFGIQILCAAVRIVLDKNCQKLYNKFS